MEIILQDLDDLIPYIRNPRKNQNIQKVAVSIKEFGFRQPIVVDKKLNIIAGHTRYQASKLLGLKKVPIHIAKELSAAQIAAYRIADNRVAQDSEWDIGLLNTEFTDLLDMNYDLELLGFDSKELEDLVVDKDNKDLADEDTTLPTPEVCSSCGQSLLKTSKEL
jgi:ParB-like chromosome segregation protein Spo0J|tara:strand:- start:1919 stop:2410 length:492 start_codon:yes stop_codon:yes gene_type:complete